MGKKKKIKIDEKEVRKWLGEVSEGAIAENTNLSNKRYGSANIYTMISSALLLILDKLDNNKEDEEEEDPYLCMFFNGLSRCSKKATFTTVFDYHGEGEKEALYCDEHALNELHHSNGGNVERIIY